jgi:hypothetical protein
LDPLSLHCVLPISDQLPWLAAGILLIAFLYSSVGHAGASGYIAVMTLFGLAPAEIKPTALVLNILVASFTVYRFRQARFFSWSALWPFLLGSVPLAAIGGFQSLSRGTYYVAMGIVLLVAASYLVWRAFGTRPAMDESIVRIKRIPAMLTGAAIGFLSGLIGVGGGIFLSPIILLLGWAGPKTTAGISAPFILVNSAVALAAGSFAVPKLPAELPLLAGAALVGALVGTWLGLEHFRQKGLLTTLATVMSLAGAKLILTA